MSESTMAAPVRRGSPHASLAVLGSKLQDLDLFGPIHQRVRIAQKTVRYTPTDKLYDAFIALLAGAHGVVEVNSTLRADPALQRAFGRAACAEQSVVQDTLDAATAENVTQLQEALAEIYRAHSAGYRHDYAAQLQILDLDLSGAPCGPKAAFATPGYFASTRARTGRQIGRVLASRYREIVVEQLYAGKEKLSSSALGLLDAAANTLQLDAARRARTVVRMDGGGGSGANVNAILADGYHYHGKDYAAAHATKAAASVEHWQADPRVKGRQASWVAVPGEYGAPLRAIVVRCAKKNGQWGVGLLLSSLPPAEVWALLGQPPPAQADPVAEMWAYVYFYDDRGGGIETSFKEDNQGLGRRVRNKKRFAAQEVVNLLAVLAHNVLIWGRTWVVALAPQVGGYGLKRLVRDVWGIAGQVEVTADGQIRAIILNEANHLAHHLVRALQELVRLRHIVVSLGET